MNVPTDPGPWTPEQTAEAMLDVAVKSSPDWADRAWLLCAMARDAAPPDERAAWVDTVRNAYVRDVIELCERIVATAGATQEQARRFADEVSAAMATRLAELAATAVVNGGRA